MSVAKPAVGETSADSKSLVIDEPVKPITPRRGLFISCVVLFIFWVAAMIWMYFATVYRHRAH